MSMKTTIISIVFVAATTLFCLPVLSQITGAHPQHEVEYQEDIKYKDFRFALGGGYALRAGSVQKLNNKVLDDMSAKLRHGFTVDADAQYFFKKSWGLGLNANMGSFSTSGGNFKIPGVEGTVNDYKETQRLIYIGPSFASRMESDKFILLVTIGFGGVYYTDDMIINGVELNLNQTTFGTNISISGEYKLNNKMGLGLKVSSTAASIDSMNFQGQKIETEEKVSASNFAASVFLSFRSW